MCSHQLQQAWQSIDISAKIIHCKHSIRKDLFQKKSKFITEDQFAKHMNITIHQLNSNETLIKAK
jgi:hypothetical protein